MQRVFLIYDISEDKARSKIANACLDYGLDRVQFSAFSGRLSRNHQEELIMQIGDLLGSSDGNVKLIPLCENDWKQRLEIDHA